MTGDRTPAWPPVISHAQLSRGVYLGNVALTVLAWSAFAYAVVANFEIGWNSLRMNRGLIIIVALVAILALSTLASGRRRKRALLGTPPSPAPDHDLARDLGLDEPELVALRSRQIVTLDLGESGTLRCLPDG